MQSIVRWASGRLFENEFADELMRTISEFVAEIQTLTQQQVSHSYSAPTIRGRYGRPRYLISSEQLRFLLTFSFTTRQIADILGVSKRTVKRRLRQFNLSLQSHYTNLTDSDLDERVQEVINGNDELGVESVRARLIGIGVVVQRQRVRQSLNRIDPGAAAHRAMSHRLHRRTYSVAGPNSLWHLDGNHKLIRWRIVIHGGIDGYSRLVIFLKASTNNCSSTVLKSFVDAVSIYGVPSRVRCDQGGENNAVCMFMEVFRGSSRGSALRGRSTHNQRIERLWGDVWKGLTNIYHLLFTFLENEGILDSNNEMHLWALHYVYLPRINRDLQLFVNQWNHHKIRTARYMSPYQIFIQGSLAQQTQNRTAIRGLFVDQEANPPSEVQMAPAALPDFDWPEEVQVPTTQFHLEERSIQELFQLVNPLAGARDSMGTDLLAQVLDFLRNN